MTPPVAAAQLCGACFRPAFNRRLRSRQGPASCNTTANKYVRVVQTILNKAEREWSWGNRAAILKTYDEGLPRDAAPTPYEVVKLVEVMPAHTADMMVYGAMTMHRRANVTDLAWSMIDLGEARRADRGPAD